MAVVEEFLVSLRRRCDHQPSQSALLAEVWPSAESVSTLLAVEEEVWPSAEVVSTLLAVDEEV